MPGLASAYSGVCWYVVSRPLFLACESLDVSKSWICAGRPAMIKRRRACLCVGVVRASRLG